MNKNEKILETYPSGLPKKVIAYEKDDINITPLYEIEYWDNGNMKIEKKYSSPNEYRLNQYFKNGQLMESTGYLNDKKSDAYSKYLENGRLVVSGNYSSDLESGNWEHYDEDGNQMKGKDFASGREILERFPDGTCKREIIRNRSNHYTNKLYHENGQLYHEYSYYLYNDDKIHHGKQRDWYMHGQLKYEQEWVKNRIAGKSTSYHSNGDISAVYDYDENGQEHGEYFHYYDNGQIEEKGLFNHGDWGEGERVWYKRNGKIKKRAVYKNGKWRERPFLWWLSDIIWGE